MAFERTASLRGATLAAVDEDAEESEPLLSGRGRRKKKGDSPHDSVSGQDEYAKVGGAEKDGESRWARCARCCRWLGYTLAGIVAILLLAALGWGIWIARNAIVQRWVETFPPSCAFSVWADWGACSASCGVGEMRTTRVAGPPNCEPKPAAEQLVRATLCELRECGGRACVVGAWDELGPRTCSEPCGPGEQTRVRPVLVHPDATGKPCPTLYQQAFCQVQPCSLDCRLSPWTGWSQCSATCGLGYMSRTRVAEPAPPGGVCPKGRETAPCELAACPARCFFEIVPSIAFAEHSSVQRCNGTESGHICHFECEEGYRADGPLTCVEGLFVLPRCLPSACEEVPEVEGGIHTHDCWGYPSGSSCKLLCKTGLRSTGDLKCEYGKFSTEKCIELTCDAPPRIEHSAPGLELCKGVPRGARCEHFECEPGYTKSEELVCHSINFNHPTCREAPCTQPMPNVWNAGPTVLSRCTLLLEEKLPVPSRTVCPLSCADGFEKTGDIVCLRGQWRAAECKGVNDWCFSDASTCGTRCFGSALPQVVGALRPNCPNASHGGTCELRCQLGRRPTGDFLCVGGTWEEAACLLPRCASVPSVDDAASFDGCAGAPDGSFCVLACAPGFAPTAPSLRCEAGAWRGASCVQEPCGPPPLPQYSMGRYDHCVGLQRGEWCPLHCEVGYLPLPPQGFECVPGGRFERTKCEPQICQAAPWVRHSGDLSACAGALSGSFCELSCGSGFEKVGDLFCEKGKWSKAFCYPMEVCGQVPDIPHAERSLYDCVDTPDGAACESFRCNPGYIPSEPLRCQRGEFNFPRCEEMGCSEVPQVPHALPMSACRNMASSGVCRVECELGYAKTGDLVCRKGMFNLVACEGPLDSLPPTRESISAELWLRMPYTVWMRRSRGTVLAARLVRAVAGAAGTPPSRVLDRGARPRSLDTTAVDIDFLPAEDAASAPAAQAFRKAREALHPALEFLGKVSLSAELVHRGSTIGRLCTKVPRIENAADLAFCVYTLSGDECPLVCIDGHIRTGNLVCVDGEWNAPECIGVPCEAPPVVENSEDLQRCAGIPSGSLCPTVCAPGYRRSLDPECRKGSYTASACEPLPCTYAPRVRFGSPEDHTQCRGMSSDQRCMIRCLPGFFPDGEGALLCERGNWRHLGSCRPADCFMVPVVAHAATDLRGCVGTRHGTSCPFACEAGYNQVGSLRCMFGQFEAARCTPQGCTRPPMVRGLLRSLAEDCVPAASGWTCAADCGMGFKLSEPLVCTRGQWSQSACVPEGAPLRSCDYPPTVPGAADVTMCIGTKPGMGCQPMCSTGHRLNRDLLCGNGTWREAICEAVECAEPSVAHSTGLAECAEMAHGSFCMLRCRVGYTPGGRGLVPPSRMESEEVTRMVLASSLECDAGEWRGPGCDEAPCDSAPPGVANAEGLADCAGTPSRAVCGLRCAPGFYAVGNPECVQGDWRSMQLARCEEAPCTTYPEVQNALDLSACINRESGEECPLACHPGFQPTGPLRCHRGLWLPAACVARCMVLPDIDGAADLSHCAGTRAGAYCRLVCRLGLRASGELRCLETGGWEVAFCYDEPTTIRHAAEVSAALLDINIVDAMQVEALARALHGLCARFLHTSPDLVAAEPLPASPPVGQATYYLVLRVLCKAEHEDCAVQRARLKHLFSSEGGASEDSLHEAMRTTWKALVSDSCSGICPPRPATVASEEEGPCRSTCMEGLGACRVQGDGKVRLVDVDLTDFDARKELNASRRALEQLI